MLAVGVHTAAIRCVLRPRPWRRRQQSSQADAMATARQSFATRRRFGARRPATGGGIATLSACAVAASLWEASWQLRVGAERGESATSQPTPTPCRRTESGACPSVCGHTYLVGERPHTTC